MTQINVLELVKPKNRKEGNAIRLWKATLDLCKEICELSGSDLKPTELLHIAMIRLKAEVEQAK